MIDTAIDVSLLTAEEREIWERADKATPGPWQVLEVQGHSFVAARPTPDHPYFGKTRYMDVAGDEDYPLKEADNAFIAASRTDIPSLLRTLADMRTVLREHEWEPSQYGDLRCPVQTCLAAKGHEHSPDCWRAGLLPKEEAAVSTMTIDEQAELAAVSCLTALDMSDGDRGYYVKLLAEPIAAALHAQLAAEDARVVMLRDALYDCVYNGELTDWDRARRVLASSDPAAPQPSAPVRTEGDLDFSSFTPEIVEFAKTKGYAWDIWQESGAEDGTLQDIQWWLAASLTAYAAQGAELEKLREAIPILDKAACLFFNLAQAQGSAADKEAASQLYTMTASMEARILLLTLPALAGKGGEK